MKMSNLYNLYIFYLNISVEISIMLSGCLK